MMPRLLSAPRLRVTALLTAVVAVVGFGAWTLWPVHDSSCVVYYGTYAPLDAPKTESDAMMQRARDKALADGACGPWRPRFRNWSQ